MERINTTAWSVNVLEWDPIWQAQAESLFCQGNGYLGIRYAVDENEPGQKRDTLIAGTFDSCCEEVSELPNVPDVMGKKIVIDREPLLLHGSNHKNYSLSLNMSNGLITRTFTYETASGKQLDLCMERFVSLHNRHLVMQRLSIQLHDEASLIIKMGINGQMTNSGAQHFTEGSRCCIPGALAQLSCRTTDSAVEFAIACAPVLRVGEGKASIDMERRSIGTCYQIQGEMGQRIVLEQASAFYTSRDKEYIGQDFDGVADARMLALAAVERGFDESLKESGNSWKDYWKIHDIEIDSTNPLDACVARFALYHLRIMTPVHDDRMNIGAKGLSGEAYKGHTFWDTEMFLLAPWLYTEPQVAGKLLRYRFHTLQKAREKAALYGCRGALFPWESAWIEDGEVTPLEGEADVVTGKPIPIYTGIQEIHVNADIAYAVWNYGEITGDEAFMEECGYEIILSTAMYWVDRAKWKKKTQRYEIQGVIGPDEYSEQVSNNAYTNYMAAWNLHAALLILERLRNKADLLDLLNERTGAAIAVSQIRDVADHLYLPKSDGEGIIPQDDSFRSLPKIDLSPYKSGTKKILELYNVEQLCGYQVAKQGDTVMLMMVRRNLFSEEIIRNNYLYYEKCCVHDSSLSYSVHSILAARLGMVDESYQMFQKAAAVDLSDSLSSAEGIHAAAMGGIWQCIIMGFAGFNLDEGRLVLEPHLPVNWNRISFAITWRREVLAIAITKTDVQMKRENLGKDIPLLICGSHELMRGKEYHGKIN